MGDEITRCRWCGVLLSPDGSCPSREHPKRCPVCGGELQQLFCSDPSCLTNTIQPTSTHSSFPPQVRGIDRELEQPVSERAVRLARVIGVLMSVDHPDECDDEQERDTSPAVRVLFPSTPPSNAGSYESFSGQDDPPTVRLRVPSGVFLCGTCRDEHADCRSKACQNSKK